MKAVKYVAGFYKITGEHYQANVVRHDKLWFVTIRFWPQVDTLWCHTLGSYSSLANGEAAAMAKIASLDSAENRRLASAAESVKVEQAAKAAAREADIRATIAADEAEDAACREAEAARVAEPAESAIVRTVKHAAALVRAFGVRLRPTGFGDIRVCLHGDTEEGAYYASDLSDAVDTAMELAWNMLAEAEAEDQARMVFLSADLAYRVAQQGILDATDGPDLSAAVEVWKRAMVDAVLARDAARALGATI